MAHSQNAAGYLTSIGAELAVQSKRVRDLIGDVHWLSDGTHKEHLLQDLLTRHLPPSVLASRGFVVSTTSDVRCSTEQDILLIDALAEMPLFHQGGLAVTFPRTVIASLSVKTRLTSATVRDSVAGLASVRAIAHQCGEAQPVCVTFFFEEEEISKSSPEVTYTRIKQAYEALSSDERAPLSSADTWLDVFCTPGAYFFRCEPATPTGSLALRGFACDGLATGLLLGILADALATRRGVSRADIADFAQAPGTDPLVPGAVTFQL
jgi:hypothetical protein